MGERRVIVAPSVLAADFAKVGEESERAEAAGADWLHLDVMDGHFVDNISFGPAMVSAVRRSSGLPLDVHLMIERPDHYAPRFYGDADGITVHVEARHDVGETLRGIRSAGRRAGLALNPATPLSAAGPWLGEIDLLLVMTVVPGFGGQAFLREMLGKIREAAALREAEGLAFAIEVDGGIDGASGPECAEAGADVLVAGTALFRAASMPEAIAALRGAGKG